jgi:hypothetical protein
MIGFYTFFNLPNSGAWENTDNKIFSINTNFFSQIPSMETRRSISSLSTESRLSEVTSAEASNSTRIDDEKKRMKV